MSNNDHMFEKGGEDATPTWSALLPAMLHALEMSKNQKAKDEIKQELKRMARLADITVKRAKQETKDEE